MWHPERITAIISQNGNMYEEGLGKKWEARKAYWANPTQELRQQFSSAFALESHHTEIAKLIRDFLERKLNSTDVGSRNI